MLLATAVLAIPEWPEPSPVLVVLRHPPPRDPDTPIVFEQTCFWRVSMKTNLLLESERCSPSERGDLL